MLELSKHQLIIPDYELHMISYDHVSHMIINDQHLGTIMFIDNGPVEVSKKRTAHMQHRHLVILLMALESH